MPTGKKPTPRTRPVTPAQRAAPYKIDSHVKKPRQSETTVWSPNIGKSLERQTLEKLKIGQSFAVTDLSLRRRLSDLCCTLKRETGKTFTVLRIDAQLRVWRDK